MPTRAPRICRDCNQVEVKNGYCAAHQHDNRAKRTEQARRQERTDSGLKALYDSSTWRKLLRPLVLGRDPLCTLGILCEGKEPSTAVDHIIRAEIYIAQHGGDQIWFFDEQNLRGVCSACHQVKSNQEVAGTWREREG